MREWWVGLSRRERIAVLSAAALVVLAVVYLAGIEPAWRARSRLAADLPRLRAEAAELDQLAAEAATLKLRIRTLESPEQTRAALTRLLAEKGVAGAQLRDEGERIVVSAKRTEVAGWLAWLKDASSQLPLRIAAARIARVGAGLVDAEVTLMPAARK